jgi:hypothetical protein
VIICAAQRHREHPLLRPRLSLGGQSLDSILISSGAIFSSSQRREEFTMPTYYPPKHP